MKARIVIVDGSTAVTGGLRCAVRSARLLSPWADMTLVLPTGSTVPAAELTAFDKVVHLHLRPLRKTVPAMVGYLPALLLAGWQLRRLLTREGAQALILNDFTMGQGAVARALGYRGRIVTWVRFDPTRFPRVLSRAWLDSAFRASDAVVAVSDFIRDLLPPSPKLYRVYDSIDLDLPAQLPNPGSCDIVCVGNYIQGKGQDHAIAAFARIADEFADTRLIFHGGDMGLHKNQAYLDALKRQAEASGFAGRILFRPFTPDIAGAFKTAAAALMLSRSESFSLTCLEASQLGVPVVSFRSGGPAEIIDDGVTGYLCDLGDVEGVARALGALLRDPDKARRMGEAGAGYVMHKFGKHRFIADARELLDIDDVNQQGN